MTKEELKRYRKLICEDCSPRMKAAGLETKVTHELSLTLYDPNIRYRCIICGKDKWIKMPRRVKK